MKRLTHFKAAAFFEEFPFLEKIKVGSWCPGQRREDCSDDCPNKLHEHPIYLSAAETREAGVLRIDSEILDHLPTQVVNPHGISDALKDDWWFEEEIVVFFDSGCELLLTVGDEVVDEEEVYSIGEALLQLDMPDAVSYIVHVVRLKPSSSCEDDGTTGERYSVKIYKPPRNFTMSQWMEKQQLQAAAEVKAELATVDGDE